MVNKHINCLVQSDGIRLDPMKLEYYQWVLDSNLGPQPGTKASKLL